MHTHRRRSAAALAGLMAVVAALGLGTGAAPASAATTTVTITGTVTNVKGFPLAGVSVELFTSASDTTLATRVTHDAGGFRFTVAAPSKQLYLRAVDPAGRHLDTAIGPFRPTAGSTVRKNITMKGAGIIQGEISAADGKPLPASALRSIDVTIEGEDSAVLTSTGTFRIGSLPPGDHVLTVFDPTKRYVSLCYDQVPMADDEQCTGEITLIRVRAGKVTTINPQELAKR